MIEWTLAIWFYVVVVSDEPIRPSISALSSNVCRVAMTVCHCLCSVSMNHEYILHSLYREIELVDAVSISLLQKWMSLSFVSLHHYRIPLICLPTENTRFECFWMLLEETSHSLLISVILPLFLWSCLSWLESFFPYSYIWYSECHSYHSQDSEWDLHDRTVHREHKSQRMFRCTPVWRWVSRSVHNFASIWI